MPLFQKYDMELFEHIDMRKQIYHSRLEIIYLQLYKIIPHNIPYHTTRDRAVKLPSEEHYLKQAQKMNREKKE